jgi:uncharacterized protein (TIGR02145 family)
MKKIILLFAGLVILNLKNQAQTVSDIDGNVYNTVSVGTQVWMKENLKVRHYKNGDPIPNVTSQTSWDTLTSGAYSDYNNDINNVNTYGRLYNWYAVSDIRDIAPEGWHVPTDADWNTLFDFLGGTAVAGNKLRETGNNHWDSYNGGDGNKYATNSSGFTALPGGFRIVGETFEYMTDFGFWWSSVESSMVDAYYIYMTISSVSKENYKKAMGGSIRLIKDSPITKIDGNYSIDNIKIYPNPAFNQISIVSNESQIINIQIYNMIGACVLQKELGSNNNNINISSLPKGIYVIKLFISQSMIQKKLIKI